MADHLGQLVQVRRALFVNHGSHFGVGRDDIREDRDQLAAEAHHPAIAHVQIQTGHELAMAAAGDQQGFAHDHGFGQRVMRVAGQDNVNAVDAAGHLAVHVETVMRQHHDQVGALPAHLVDHFCMRWSRMPKLYSGNIQPGFAMGM